jgi:hypothetical protein
MSAAVSCMIRCWCWQHEADGVYMVTEVRLHSLRDGQSALRAVSRIAIHPADVW